MASVFVVAQQTDVTAGFRGSMKTLIRRAWIELDELMFRANPFRLLRERRLRRARSTGQAFVARMPGIGVKMIIRPEMYFSRTYARRPFEPGTVNFIKRSVKPGMTVFDVGANIGFFTLLFARLVGTTGRVVAFEPGQYAGELLERNVAINGFSQVSIIKRAVGDWSGTVCLLEGPEGFDVYSSLSPIIVHPAAQEVAFTKRTVQQITIDGFVRSERISHVDFVKVDVEGAELSVFRGMHQLMVNNPPGKLLFEVGNKLCNTFGYTPKDIVSEVESFGYRCWRLDGRGRMIAIDWKEPWLGAMVVGLQRAS